MLALEAEVLHAQIVFQPYLPIVISIISSSFF